MKRLRKRIISGITIFSVLLTMLPMSAFSLNTFHEKTIVANDLSQLKQLYSDNVIRLSRNYDISIWDGSISQNYAGGSGTEEDPYLIENGAQLAKIAIDAQNRIANKYYKLVSDIYLNDVSDPEWYTSLSLNQWTPIGSKNDPDGNLSSRNEYQFSGNFDGQGHTIYGIYINDDTKKWCGLFGCIINANICNLKVSDSYILGNSAVGAIAGYQTNRSTITNCQSNASIFGSKQVGGIVGDDDLGGIYEYCANLGTINGELADVGGIVGSLYLGSSVSSCYNIGEIRGGARVGGIVGYAYEGSMTGKNIIENSYNCGNIYAIDYDSHVQYAGGTGGIVGYLYIRQAMRNCYNVGTVKSDNPEAKIGALFGEAEFFSEVSNCYYLNTAIDQGVSSASARTDEEMRQESTFKNYDFDNIWFIDSQSEYPYPQLIFPDSRSYAKIVVADKNTNEMIFDYQIDITPDSGLYAIPSEDETDNLTYIVGQAGSFSSHIPINVSKDGYEEFLCYSDDLQKSYSLANAYENVIYLTPSTGLDPDIDVEQQKYILEHVNFVQNSFSNFVSSKGFQNAYWQFDNGDSLYLADIGNWMSNVSEIFSGEFTDIKISATYYDLFLADFMTSMADMEKSTVMNTSIFDSYKKYNLATVDNWIKKFKEIDSKKLDLFSEIERESWESLMSDIEYMTNKTGQVGWDALAFDLECFFRGEDKDYQIDNTTKKLIEFITTPTFLEKNSDMINDVFEGLSVASEVSGYISNASNTITAFQQSTQAYVATVTCSNMYSELFNILDDVIAKMDSQYADKFAESLADYKAIATDKTAMYLECTRDLIGGTIFFTYNSFLKDYVTKAIYTDLGKLLGCPASTIKAIVMAYNVGFGIGDTITGLSEKSEQYTFMYYVSPLEKALEETVAQYGEELCSSNSYGDAQKFDTSFKMLAATNKYLYHCMYTLGASGLPITIGDKHFGQLPIFMELSSKLTSDWDNVKCHGNYTFISNEYKYINIQCPVDVYVYDLNNDTILSIVSEDIIEMDESISAYVSNGRKSLILPIDNDYSIKIIPRENGIMNYSVMEIAQNTRSIEFYNIPLKTNNYYTGNIPAGLQNSVELYSLNCSDGNTIKSNYDSRDTQIRLSTPQFLNWYETKAKWEEVENASRYLVSLYCNGDLNKIVYTNTPEYDFSAEMLRSGMYTFDVIAISDTQLIKDSRRSDTSYIYEIDSSEETINVTGISLNKDTLEFTKSGTTETLIATITPANATNKSVAWSSSNPDVATIDDTGLVTALSNGTTTITAKTIDGNHMAYCTVTVTIQSTSSGGSSSSGNAIILHTIAIQNTTGGSITINNKTAVKGEVINVIVAPDKGYSLKNIILADKNGNPVELTQKSDTEYTFIMPNSDVTIMPTFIKTTDDSETSSLPFYDVSKSDWWYEAVEYVYLNHMMQGTAETLFSPDAEMSRAMIATVLYRLENTPAPTEDASFNDVETNKWYTDAIRWAAENNVINGYGNNRFGPMDSVTREQLAVILYNYTASKGISVEAVGDLSTFSDAEATSDWAEEAISWAVGVGLLSGKGNGILDPSGTATRAEFAQMLMNYLTKAA